MVYPTLINCGTKCIALYSGAIQDVNGLTGLQEAAGKIGNVVFSKPKPVKWPLAIQDVVVGTDMVVDKSSIGS